MAAQGFGFTYLQTFPQSLVEVQDRARNHDHLCSKHNAENHSATLTELGTKSWKVGQERVNPLAGTIIIRIKMTESQQAEVIVKKRMLFSIVSRLKSLAHLVSCEI